MPRKVTHGQVRRSSEANPYAVPVTMLEFQSLAAVGPLPPAGTTGTLTTARVPTTPYTKSTAQPVPANETIVYEDGNNNNTLRMRVTGVHGPSKYNIEVL